MSKLNVRSRLNRLEKQISFVLSIVYSLRLLGIFLLLPVFSIYASQLAGGDDRFWIGLAFGLYGLMQAACQLPLGVLSDRFGRKKIIVAGLSVFAFGSFLCAFADNIFMLSIARAVQGAGAVSAAVVALLADTTRDEVRTRAMSLIGASIGLTFSGSLIVAPILDRFIGVSGVFILTGVGAILGIFLILFAIPKEETFFRQPEKMNFTAVLKNADLWRLNFGIFALHAAQMAMFIALPFVLQDLGFVKADLWKIYFPVTLIGVILMIPAVIVGEVKHKLKAVLLLSIMLLLAAQFGLSLSHNIMPIVFVLSLYFIGLNIAEAVLPSAVSKIAPKELKGTAMGIYNTAMSLGLFSGSVIGGLLLQRFDSSTVFIFCGGLMLLWLVVSLFLPQLVKS
ncbi:MAG: MFS transporter [Neisseriaceae bacterium]|nr:MFS transporter [Neisseriaceae bacterium]